MHEQPERTFVPVRRAAVVLGVPASWLKREVERGALPGILAGRSWLVDLSGVREALQRRARSDSRPRGHWTPALATHRSTQ